MFQKTRIAATISLLIGSAAIAMPAVAQEEAGANDDVEV